MSGQGRLTELEGFPSPDEVADSASLSEHDLLEILEREGWTLNDVELACRRLLMERNPR